MDDGRNFTSLTLVEEDFFETGESTDGESEDLDELISKAENSQHLWLNCDSDEYLTDVELLQNKLKQKDEGLHLTAKIGKKLLLNTNKLTSQNLELKAQVSELKEELSQLKYLQSSKGRSFQCYEISDEEDEGTFCRIQSLSPHSNTSNSSHISLSASLEETFSLRRQIEQLQQNNQSLRDELKTLQQEALDEVDHLKEHYNHEFLNAKKLIGNLEKKIENGENRFSKFEYETNVWKESVEALAAKCNLHECEIDELQGEISKIKLDQKEEKHAMQQLVRENAELKDLVLDLKNRVHDMEQTNRPKVLRHVPDSSSPYVDSKSFTQELEQEHLEGNKDTRIATFCPNPPPALPHFISHVVYQPDNIFAKLREMLTRSVTLKLGQPGRPGSTDLELAVSGLPFVDPLLSAKDPAFASKAGLSWFRCQMRYLEALLSEKQHLTIRECQKEKEVTPCKAHNSSNEMLAPALPNSKFLQNWSNLGTPNLTTIFRKQSGIWIKGVAVGEVFIEENFARMGLEVEEDELLSVPSLSLKACSAKSDCNRQPLSKSKLHYKLEAFVSTHKSLDDIAKCTYDGMLVPLKSYSLSDMPSGMHRDNSPLSLNRLWKQSESGLNDVGAFELDSDFMSSMKIVRSSNNI